MSVACNGLDLDKDTNDTEVDDGPDGGNEEGEEGEEGDDIVPSLKAIFDAMPAGIYIYRMGAAHGKFIVQ